MSLKIQFESCLCPMDHHNDVCLSVDDLHSVQCLTRVIFFLEGMMEQSKRASLSVARSILNHKLIGKKLESYLKVCLCCLAPNNAMEIKYVLNLLVQLSLCLDKMC